MRMKAIARLCPAAWMATWMAAWLGLAAAVGAPVRASAAVGMPDLPTLPSTGEQVVIHDQAGIALFGFDPVAYFAEGRAVGGQARHELLHEGLVWRFASAANRAAFERAPQIYLPAFGGYDPTGIAAGRAVDSRPEHFAIINDRLHLFRTREARQRGAVEPDLLAIADQRWPEVQRLLAR
jgi:hypothetical protein